MAEAQEPPAPRPRRPWWLVVGAILAIGMIVVAVYSGPAGWGAMILVWLALLLLKRRGD